jgi:hypothetical protein
MTRSRSDWERIFSTWSQGPAPTESAKAENAERAIRKAIDASRRLQSLHIDVFPQGSYRNRTNVRQDSDVDICVRCMSVFRTELPDGVTNEDAGLADAPYTYAEFKNDVQQALVDYFGRSAVTRGNKAFDVHANTNRVDADVVPTFEFRKYRRNPSGALSYISGTLLTPDSGRDIRNYPNQHYERGIEKNTRTQKTFKRTVRILKRLRNEMAAAGVMEAAAIPSYLIECLVGSVPEDSFFYDNWHQVVRAVLAEIFNGTVQDKRCRDWLEINRIKILFHVFQPWQRQVAHDFAAAAWDYIGFED